MVEAGGGVVAVQVAFVSVVVTVLLFVVSQVIVVVTARASARAALVQDVLDALSSVARTHARPSVARLWTKPEIEYALLVPRLLVGLPKRDRVVAAWVQTRVQDMSAAVTQNQVIRIASDTSAKVAEWQMGERSREWFRQQTLDHQKPTPRPGVRSFLGSAEATAGVMLGTGPRR